MAERVRRRQDDYRTARPPHAPLRDHRDRQRELALQTPRLTVTPVCPGEQTSYLPRCATPDSRRSLRSARGPPVGYQNKPVPMPNRGPDWTPTRGQTSAPIDIGATHAVGQRVTPLLRRNSA